MSMITANVNNLEGSHNQFTKYDYEFLTGTWEGPGGAAIMAVYEYCKGAGLGDYGKPTEKGRAAILKWVIDNDDITDYDTVVDNEW